MANNVHLVGKHFIQKSKKNLTGKAEKIKNYVFVLRVTYLFGYILLVVVRNKFVFFCEAAGGLVQYRNYTVPSKLSKLLLFHIVKVVSGKQKLIFHQSLYFQKTFLLIESKTKSSEI